ncbi:MAG TPA: heme-binding protein [Thermoanaerobaculia bacterium]
MPRVSCALLAAVAVTVAAMAAASAPTRAAAGSEALQPRRHRHPTHLPPAVPPPTPVPSAIVCDDPGAQLSQAEAMQLATQAAGAVSTEPNVTVAVVDRLGDVLALLRYPAADATLDDHAIGLARTGAFFSNDQAPLSSRTVRFISGLHFPPGIHRTPNAALYGIENTNRGCDLNVTFLSGQSVPPARRFAGGPCQSFPPGSTAGCGTGPVTGKLPRLDSTPSDSDADAVDPGGLPVFRGGAVVGGIGVAGPAAPEAEHAAFAAVAALFPPPQGEIFLDGVRLPFAVQRTAPPGAVAGTPPGSFATGTLPGGLCAPSGYLAGPSAGVLTAAEVDQIVQQAVATAGRTRAAIRLPIGSRTRMTIAVADLDGTILALYRMPDATVFSIDVAVAKARNVVYFTAGSPEARSDLPGAAGHAVTNRTIGFGAQNLFPPGIDGSGPGPFLPLFHGDWQSPCTQGSQPATPNQNGVVFFPGSLPLYRNGALAGGLGVSGDGVEQDDYVTFGGAQGFVPPSSLWADQVMIHGVRLPFLKFPRNPEG